MLERLRRLRFDPPANKQPIGQREQDSWRGIGEGSSKVSPAILSGRQSIANGAAVAPPRDDSFDSPKGRLVTLDDLPDHLASASRDVELLGDLFSNQCRVVGTGPFDLE